VRDRDWLARFISTPDKVLAANDPIAKALFTKYKQVNMPNLNLRPEDVNTVIRYLELENEAFSKATSTKDADAGKMEADMKMDHSKMDHSMMHHAANEGAHNQR
jgi:hypothetical protein